MVATARTQTSFSLSSYLVSDGPAGFLLSWVAGFVDTSAFIILFGIFTAHVTGNIALAGSSFVSDDEASTVTRLLMLPTFVLTVALTSLLARYARRKQWPVFAVLLTIPYLQARSVGGAMMLLSHFVFVAHAVMLAFEKGPQRSGPALFREAVA